MSGSKNINATPDELPVAEPDSSSKRRELQDAARGICGVTVAWRNELVEIAADLDVLDSLRTPFNTLCRENREAIQAELEEAQRRARFAYSDRSAALKELEADRRELTPKLEAAARRSYEEAERMRQAPTSLRGYPHHIDVREAEMAEQYEFYRDLAKQTRTGSAHHEPA
jgi:hypothetical protein